MATKDFLYYSSFFISRAFYFIKTAATSQHTQAWQIGRLGPIRTEKCMPRNALELLDMEGFKRERKIANVSVNEHIRI